MKKMIFSLLVVFGLTSVGCKSLRSTFGCSSDSNVPPLDLQLGTPGETKVENNLPENPEVESLGAEETIEFISDDGEAWVHHKEDRLLEEGDVIVANEEQRLLVKVKKVVEKHDKKTKVILRQSRISDVVGENSGSLSVLSTPIYSIEDMDKLNNKAKENGSEETIYQVDSNGKITIRNLELFSIDVNNDGNISKGVNKILGIPVRDRKGRYEISGAAGGRYRAVVNSAEIEVIPSVRNNAEWEWGRVSKLNARLDTRVRYRMDVTYEAAGNVKLEVLMNKFMPKKIIPVRVPGTPPVWLDVELAMPAGASLKAETAGTSRVIFESEYEFYSYINYDKETGIASNKDYRTIVKEKSISTAESTMKVEAEIFLKPSVTTRFYRVVGATGYVRPYLRGEIEFPSVRKKDDLFIGAAGAVGLELTEPIFVSNIVSYTSDEYTIFEKSFDLDGRGQAEVSPFKVDSRVTRAVTVDRVGPEGFVVFDLKENKDDQFLRYELVETPDTGLMVPSETFFMDGSVYYYPLKDSVDETFKVKITGKDGQSEIVEIAINPTPAVIAEVSKDRFGTTTNSYKVSSGSPGEFADDVPHHNLGGGGGVMVERLIPEVSPELERCALALNYNPRQIRQVLVTAQRFEWSCGQLMNTYNDFFPFGNTPQAFEKWAVEVDRLAHLITRPIPIEKGKSIAYRMASPTSFLGFTLLKNWERAQCIPEIVIKSVFVEEKPELQLTFEDCEMDSYYQSQFHVTYTKERSRYYHIDEDQVDGKRRLRVQLSDLGEYPEFLGDLKVTFKPNLDQHLQMLIDKHLKGSESYVGQNVKKESKEDLALNYGLEAAPIQIELPIFYDYKSGFHSIEKSRLTYLNSAADQNENLRFQKTEIESKDVN